MTLSRASAALAVFVIPALLAAVAGELIASETPPSQSRLRRPAALLALGDFVYVANQRSGSLSVIDSRTQQRVGETDVGGSLVDLAAVGHGKLLAVDAQHHQLVLLDVEGANVRILQRLPVPQTPVTVVVTADGRRAAVASLWAQQLTFVDIRPAVQPPLTVAQTLDLPFAPRAQCVVGPRLIIAEAFGGELAVLDVNAMQLTARRSIEGHNIRSLAVSEDGSELYIPHQLLDSRVYSEHSRVFWGNLIANVIRSVPLATLLNEGPQNEAKPIAHWSLYSLGRPGEAAGDPSSILITPHGQLAVACAGVNQIELRQGPTKVFEHVAVGSRPSGLALSPDGERLFVANMLDDTLSVLDLTAAQVVATVPLGPPIPLAAADRGEQLFFNARASLDGWMSCHSCHTDGHSNGLLNDNFGDESFGAPKRVLSLLGAGETPPYSWNGGQPTLVSQIHKSIERTMQGGKSGYLKDDNLQDLAAYLQTLPPPPGLDKARGALDSAQVARGQALFQARGCGACHAAPTYTTPAVYDVGIEDEYQTREFNPPSLRGVSQQRALLHDNRAKNLHDLFRTQQHQGGGELSAAELADLLAFLRSL